MVHDFGEIILFAEDVLELCSGFARLFILAKAQSSLNLAGNTAGGGDDALAIGVEQLAVHTWLEVIAIKPGLG